MNEFRMNLKSYPLIFYHNYDDKSYLENSNKVLLPTSVLNNINRFSDNISGNILFKITGNIELNCIVSVEEFIEDISDIYLPYNIIEKLSLNEGDNVILNLIEVVKGSKMIIQPYKSEFLEIEDHKSFLEEEINKYDVISKGDIISLNYNDMILNFNVCETEPENTISTKNTDIIIDFKEPLDYNEYIKKKEEEKKLKEKEKFIKQQELLKIELEKEKKKKEDEKTLKKKGYIPFSGEGRRLGD